MCRIPHDFRLLIGGGLLSVTVMYILLAVMSIPARVWCTPLTGYNGTQVDGWSTPHCMTPYPPEVMFAQDMALLAVLITSITFLYNLWVIIRDKWNVMDARC